MAIMHSIAHRRDGQQKLDENRQDARDSTPEIDPFRYIFNLHIN